MDSVRFGETSAVLSALQAEAIIQQCGDIFFHLSKDLIVKGLTSSMEFVDSEMQTWLERPFASLVAPDSRHKIERLFDDNAADKEGHWRHLNLLLDGRPECPLLMKFFRFSAESSETHLVCARSLRSIVDVTRSWQSHLDEEVRRNEREKADLWKQAGKFSKISDAINTVGERDLSSIVHDAVRLIERLCVEEALRKCEGDLEKASTLLRLSTGEVEARLRLR